METKLESVTGWKIKEISEICRVKRGASPRPKGDPRYFGGKLPWIKIIDISKSAKYLTEAIDTVTELGKEKSVFVKKETLIMSISASVGKPVILKVDGCIHDGIVAFLDLKPEIKRDYLYYFLLGNPKIVAAEARGLAQKNINSGFVREIKIPVPPLPIQDKIVARLDSFFEKYEQIKKEQEKSETGNLETSLLERIFIGVQNKYPVKSLSGVATKIGSGGTPLRSKKEYWEGTIPWIKTGELNDSIVSKAEEKITKEGLENSSAHLFPPETILVAMYGEGKTRGTTGFLTFEAATNQACCAIVPNKKIIDPMFCWFFLRSKYSFFRKAGYGGQQPNINQSIIKTLNIPVPPLDEQKKILNRIEAVFEINKKLKMEKIKQTQQLSLLPHSILSKAFSGELVS